MTLLELLWISKSNSNHQREQQLRYPWISRIVSGNERSPPLEFSTSLAAETRLCEKRCTIFSPWKCAFKRQRNTSAGHERSWRNAGRGTRARALSYVGSLPPLRRGSPLCFFKSRYLFSLSFFVDHRFFCCLILQIKMKNRDGSP